MMALAILYTLFLVGIWNFGASEETQGYSDTAVDVQVALYNQNGEAAPSNPPSGSQTIDLAIADSSIYQSFDFHYNDTPIILIVPQKGVTVVRVLSGSEKIWEGGKQEMLRYVRAYLNEDEQPELLYIVGKTPSTRSQKYLELKNGRWEDFTADPVERVKAMKLQVQDKVHFSIDLASDKDTKEYRVFGSMLVEYPFRSYAPKPGYLAKEVKDGPTSIWKGEGGYENCLLSTIYFRKGSPYLLYIDTVVFGTKVPKYFELEDGEWKICKKLKKKANSTRTIHTEL